MMLHNLPVPGIPHRRRHGFTIVEVVMAVIIIGILTLALVPSLMSHANNARLTICKQDLENLANAEERVAVDTGYLVRPYVLNDVARGDMVPNASKVWPQLPSDPIDRINGLRDNIIAQNNLYGDGGTDKPYYIFISPTTQDYLPISQQDLVFSRLTGLQISQLQSGSYTLDPNEAQPYPEQKFNWNGPYINWKRDIDNDDWPDDPWGHPYYFFTRAGMIYPPQHTLQSGSSSGNAQQGDPTIDYSYPFQNSSGVQNGSGITPGTNEPYFPVNGQNYQWKAYDEMNATKAPLFDRPTWLSLGPNGLPGDGSTQNTDPNYGYGKGDDLFYSFGGS